MTARWVGCDAGNFREGRPAGWKPEMIVLHSANGSLADVSRAFFTPGLSRSAHYAIGLDGSIVQHVRETDTAFHAGLKINPTAPLVKARDTTNPNYFSIGIELEGHAAGTQPPPPLQLRSCAALVAEIATRWRIPLDDAHVVTHQAIRASMICPGPAWSIAAVLSAATSFAGEQTFEQPLKLTLVSTANIRSGPDRQSTIVGTPGQGFAFEAVGVTRGEPVSGNDRWYFNAAGRYLWAGATDAPVPAHTERLLTSDAMDLEPEAPAPAPPGTLPVRRELALKPKDYYAVVTKKDLIVLHFTAGRTARSAYDTWSADADHVGTAYVVDTDGSIYEMFDPRYWAYHLGMKSGPAHDKRSIGIEIVNVGPLKKSSDGKSLNWWPNKFGTAFCSIDDLARYREGHYRGFDHYAAYPQQQVTAVRSLVQYLTERFSIPAALPPKERLFEHDEQFFSTYRGVATHANFRRDKFDIGPAFDWDGLM